MAIYSSRGYNLDFSGAYFKMGKSNRILGLTLLVLAASSSRSATVGAQAQPANPDGYKPPVPPKELVVDDPPCNDRMYYTKQSVPDTHNPAITIPSRTRAVVFNAEGKGHFLTPLRWLQYNHPVVIRIYNINTFIYKYSAPINPVDLHTSPLASGLGNLVTITPPPKSGNSIQAMAIAVEPTAKTPQSQPVALPL